MPNRNITGPVIGALLAVVALFGVGCSRRLEGHTDAADRLPTVAAVRPLRLPASRRAVLEAELEPYQEVDIRAKVAGQVKSIPVDIGSHVEQGQVLATLIAPELESDSHQAAATIERRRAEVQRAREQLGVSEAAFELAHVTYERLASVDSTRPGLLARQEVDTAMGRDRQSAAEVSAAKAALVAANAALREAIDNQKRAQAMVDYARISAPFTGVVTRRYVHTGTMVPAGTSSTTQGTPIVRITQTDPLRLVVYIPSSLASRVHAGMRLTVESPALQRKLELPVTRIAGAVEVASRTMRAEVEVPNPDMQLMPGEYAKVELPVERSEAALLVPVEAVIRDGDEATLWVVNSRRRLELRRVTLGIENSGTIAVTSGLSENELAAIGQTSSFRPGQEVNARIVEMTGPGGGL